MTLSSLLIFIPVYVLAVASPGPVVATVVTRTLGRGTKGSAAFILGLVAGDLTWFAAAGAGLTLLAQTYAPLFRAIQYAGAAYLLFIAWSIWHAPAKTLATDNDAPAESNLSAFLGAWFLTLGNPKTMVFFLSILPLVISPHQMSWLALVELALTASVLLSLVFCGYVLLASRARAMLRSTSALRAINRTTAGIMAATAFIVATR
ncbi:MAG: lysine transporter LysE [Rhizobiales bacterium PAR1]|nr:MAG: lysine transporter LysE [Rhizobiales bacterium PAR1]